MEVGGFAGDRFAGQLRMPEDYCDGLMRRSDGDSGECFSGAGAGAAGGRLRGAQFGQFLFTADSLADVHEYEARDFGKDSHEKALLLGLDVLRSW